VDGLSLAILYAPALGVTLLGKLAIPMGDREILVGVPLIIVATFVGVFTKRLLLDPTRFPLYLLTLGVLTALQVFAVGEFSGSSLLLLALLHGAYAFRLVGAGDGPDEHLRRFLNLALFICLAGVAQYFAQYAVGPRYAFPIEHFAPEWLLANHYNMLNPVRYGSPLFKSNGVFLAEPSYFSQLLAAGFVCEILSKKRIWRLACFCAGFVVSYSGTGLLMMAAAIPVFILVHRRFDLLGLLAAAGLLLLLFKDSLGMDVFVERALEFRDPRSSGYMRYVGGLHLLDEYLFSDPERWLFGFGAGMMFRSTPASLFNLAETGWVKILLEYGLIGGAAYFSFLFISIFRNRHPLVQRVALGVTTLVSGILDPGSHGLILSLLVWLPERETSAPPHERRARAGRLQPARREPAVAAGDVRGRA
jgi:hypothetical protein